MFARILSLSNVTLLVALALSSVAAYYSIVGLIAIFSGAVVPIIIMGSILEIGKITTTVWLRKYWDKCSFLLKSYLVPAVIALAVLTSMGIFGFLSKAHMDQGVVTGDAQAKLAIYDEKIKTERDNIDLARRALQQMDSQVDQMLTRTTDDRGTDRAVNIRRQQAKERTALQNDISAAQTRITRLNEERAPIAAETRKVEAEVGPIKYIAALIYGDNLDANLLERAVRWVIILLVVVFDPLAIALVLAANQSKEWDTEIIETKLEPSTKERVDEIPDEVAEFDAPPVEPHEPTNLTDYLSPENWDKYFPPNPKPHEHAHSKVFNLDPISEIGEALTTTEKHVSETSVTEELSVEPQPVVEIQVEGITKENPVVDHRDGYVTYEGKHMSIPALKEMHPEVFSLTTDAFHNHTRFGTEFPKMAGKGDIFVRVDSIPNRVFKFNGIKWIEVSKDLTASYLDNQEYIRFLIDKIDTGEYNIDILSDAEKQQIEAYLKKQ